MYDRPQRHPPCLKRIKTWRCNQAPKAGRPAFYGYNEYKAAWIAVQERMAKTGLSANQVCLRYRFDVMLGCFDGSPDHHTITGATLRFLYQQAVHYLKQEAAQREDLRRALDQIGATCSLTDRPLPIASVWQAELRSQLAQSA